MNEPKNTCPKGHEYDYVIPKTGHRRCRTCDRANRQKMTEAYRKADRKPKPPREVLEKEIAGNSWMALARKYGVSDVAVRKWAKGYDLL